MPLHLTTSANFTSKEAVGIGTGEMGITTSTPLLTMGAAYCIMILFHVDGRGGALAHVPPGVDELPSMKKMMEALVKLGARPDHVEVLLGGNALGDTAPTWRQSFLNKLNQVGIQLGNITDGRTGTESNPRVDIGNKGVDRIRQAVYDPKTAQVLPLNEILGETHPTKGKSSSVKVYKLDDSKGTVSATAKDGECLIL